MACHSVSAKNCSTSDLQALVDFKSGLNDPEVRLSSWRGGDCWQWRGIGCDNDTDTVIEVDHSQSIPLMSKGNVDKYGFWNLSGDVRPFLLELRSLRYLDLSSNIFDGIPIPEFLGSLTNLLYQAGFFGTIPTSLGNLSSLQYLDVSSDFLSLSVIASRLECSLVSLKHARMNLMLFELNQIGLEALLKHLPYLGSTSVRSGDEPSQSFFVSSGCLALLELRSLVSASVLLLEICRLEILELVNNNLSVGSRAFFNGSWRRIEVLDLGSNKVHGKLPSNIGNMIFLTHFNLFDNDIQESIPSTIGKLCNLAYLDLFGNHLTGSLPESLEIAKRCIPNSPLPNLMTFKLSNNKLERKLPDWLGQLFYLEELELSYNLFQGWLKPQKEIRFLDLSNSSISGHVPEWFWDLSFNLSLLNFSHNEFQGELPNKINLYSYADLDLSFNFFEGTVPLPLNPIELFDLSNNRFQGDIPLSISDSMPELTFLSLSSNQLIGDIPPTIGEMLSLQVLDLPGNNLKGLIPSEIGNCSILKVLYLGNNSLHGEIPCSLGQLNQLQSLHLTDNKLTGELPSSFRNLSSLETMDIRNNLLSENNFSGRIPGSFGDLKAMAKTPNMTEYLLYGKYRGSYYEEGTVINFLNKNQKYTKTLSLLTSIDISSNDFSGEFPLEITKLTGLRVLTMSGNEISGHIPQNISRLDQLLLDLSKTI
ncbi:hypothetical protein Leryth_027431 [Lithospermum erythrorhizon]|nr:hypothetical protein Leryth_027431 [Lithospermum erythrorhizon]